MNSRTLVALVLCVVTSGCFSPDGGDSGDSSDTSGSTAAVDSTDDGVDPSATTVVDSTTSGVDPSTSTTTTGPEDDTSTGVAGDPDIEVRIDGVVVESGDTVPLSGTSDVGVLGGTVTVTITNAGESTLSLAGVAASDFDTADFVIDQSGVASFLEPREVTTFDVSLQAVAGGIRRVATEILSNDPDMDPFELTFVGHTTPNVFRNLMPAVAPTPRFNVGMAAIPGDKMLLFGGRNNAGTRLNDTWVYDAATNNWSQLSPAGALPTARDAHQLAYIGNDKVLLFGGNTATGSDAVPVNDTFLYDVVANTWAQVIAPSPPARFQHNLVAVGPNAILFGGRTGFSGTDVNDTWRFNGATSTWTNANPAGAPTARASFAMAFDGDDTVTIYGGFQGATPVSTSFNYTPSLNSWAPAGQVGFNPGSRAVLEGEYLAAGQMIVHSGKLGSCCVDPAGGTFAYDPLANTWTQLTVSGEPAPRYNYGMGGNSVRNKVIIFGGQLLNGGPGSAVAETYEFVGPVPMP